MELKKNNSTRGRAAVEIQCMLSIIFILVLDTLTINKNKCTDLFFNLSCWDV